MTIKPTLLLLFSIIALILGGKCLPTGEDDLRKCQSTFKNLMSQISTDSEKATIRRLLFHSADLDGDGKMTSAELTLYLETKGFVHETDVMDVIGEVGAWFKFGGHGMGPLTTSQFIEVVTKSMEGEIASKESFYHVTASLCSILTFDIPHIHESMKELESCTNSLKSSAFISGGGSFNSWFAAFESLDHDGNNRIGINELKRIIGHKLTSSETLSVASALGHAIYGSVHRDVTELTEQDFYVFVHELLYGLAGEERRESWQDVYDVTELEGRNMLCDVIRAVRRKVVGGRDVMEDCVSSYRSTKDSILGADGVFAPELVFTIADSNRNGKIEREEFEQFIGTRSRLYGAISRQHAGKEIGIGEFRDVMPDRIIHGQDDVTGKLDASSMTPQELEEAEKLCRAIIDSVRKYPSANSNSDIAVDYVTHQQQFKGSGEFIVVEHPLHDHVPATTKTTSPSTSNVISIEDRHGNPLEIEILHHNPVAHGDNPTSPAPSTSGVVYEMFDRDGNPINVDIGSAQIDQIVQQMNPPTPETDLNVKKEISEILHKRIEEENDEESQLKKLLQDLENAS